MQKSNELTNINVIVMHVIPTKTTITSPTLLSLLRASPPVLSMRLQTVKFIAKKLKCAGLAQEIGFSAPNSCNLRWLVKGATQL
jgi:hypothetical protein